MLTTRCRYYYDDDAQCRTIATDVDQDLGDVCRKHKLARQKYRDEVGIETKPEVEPAKPEPLPDLDRIEMWAKGYRKLIQGGLHEEVHTACASVSEMPNGEFAYITVDDVERLLAVARKAATLNG